MNKFIVAITLLLSLPCCYCDQEPELDETSNGSFMGIADGPIELDETKWGVDMALPLSWPGRIAQLAPTSPSNPKDLAVYEIRPSVGSKLISVHTWVDPAKGHAQVPDSRAQSMLWIYNGGFQTLDLVGLSVTFGDSVVDYEQRFLMTIKPTEPVVITPDSRVFLHVYGEYGKGCVPGLRVETPEFAYDE